MQGAPLERRIRDLNSMSSTAIGSLMKKGTLIWVIANHVLFYCEDIPKVAREVKRVLKRDGRFVCSTYGCRHMMEVSRLVQGI